MNLCELLMLCKCRSVRSVPFKASSGFGRIPDTERREQDTCASVVDLHASLGSNGGRRRRSRV